MEADQVVRALRVMVLDPRHRAWLKENDPKALEQAETALKDWDNTHDPVGSCRYCGGARPPGYSVTCGRSECQEQDYNAGISRRGRR